MAWITKAFFEFITMLILARKFAPLISGYILRWTLFGILSLTMIGTAALCEPLVMRIGLTLLSTIVWCMLVWKYLFDADDRSELVRIIRTRGIS